MNLVLAGKMGVGEAAYILGLSERHTWRILAAYRKYGAAVLAHGNRDRLPPNATSPTVKAHVMALARKRYLGVNHTHFTELLTDSMGSVIPSTDRSLLYSAGRTLRSQSSHTSLGVPPV